MRKTIAVLVFMLLYSCSTPVKIVHSWVPPNATPVSFTKIIVLALAPVKYADAGRTGEEAMAAELKANGIIAISAQDQYGPQAFRYTNEETAIAKLRENGADGVMVMSLLDEDKEKKYVPGYWTQPYYGHFWGYYRFWYDRAYQPGYYETTKNYLFETNLYDLSTRNLIYSAQSRATNPGSTDKLATTFSKDIVADLKNKHVVNSTVIK